MGIKVAKFGGSSVADGIRLAGLKRIVGADPDRRYIVVSAPGKRFDGDSKVTDILYLCKARMERNLPYDPLFQAVADRFASVRINLDINVDLRDHFDKIKKNLRPGCSADYLASRGEYLSALLIASYLGYDFVDAKDMILFDRKGRLLRDETDRALKKELAKHCRAVIPGFYGADGEGNIRVFPRGGSDITGSLVAKAVGADVYENWTDVPGLLTADPKIVEGAEPIGEITYRELRELSYMGASVLQEDAVYPAKTANIPINIRDTNDPGNPGTIIASGCKRKREGMIAGIAGRKGFTAINIYKDMMGSEKGFTRKLLSVLESFDMAFERLPGGVDTVSVVIRDEDLKGRLGSILEAFEKHLGPDIMETRGGMALIAAVGRGMGKRAEVPATMFAALAKAGVDIRMIESGSGEAGIVVGVGSPDFEKAVRAIYGSFRQGGLLAAKSPYKK